MPIEKGKRKDRDPEMPIVSSRKSNGRDRDPEMPIDSSPQGKGKDRDPEIPIDSSQGKGVDDGQHTKKEEQVTESSSESSDEEYCDICGVSHCPPFCNYRIYLPPGKQLVNKEKYQVVCFCGCAVLDDGKGEEYTCGCCFLGAPKKVSLKSNVLPPCKKSGPLPDFFPEEFRRAVEYHNKIMADRCWETRETKLNYFDTDSDTDSEIK